MGDNRVPLLLISDAPSASTGLGRICRDLAIRIHANMSDVFECATLGYGGNGDKNLGFMQYPIEGMHDWFLPTLPDVWENFAGKRRGATLAIWDASRLLWFARPDRDYWSPDKKMREWLLKKPFSSWTYSPMDASGPNNKLSIMNREVLLGFDKIIAYSDWAKGIIERTFTPEQCEKRSLHAIPHGIDTAVFKPYRPNRGVFRQKCKFEGLVLESWEKIIGIVATNQTRKDWGLAMAALAEVNKDTPIRIFIQTDVLERHWSISGLLMDYGLLDRAIISMDLLTDETMAEIYSACDLTLGIGAEGYGFPIWESMACGTPCLCGDLGGQAEQMDSSMIVKREMERIDGIYNNVRPVHDPVKWAYKIRKMLAEKKTGKSLLPPRLDWNNLWPNEWEGHLRKLHQTLTPSMAQTPSPNGNKLGTDMRQEAIHTSIIASPEDP